ncbi:integrase [Rhizobium leguminosarum bv. viciae]|uniref:DUF6538 domain-containing protein n=1 Tax=Rhizobium leguminosarum TaxID=384 RepID=UPI00103889F3|nr:tyrosine-type recombinase/integrase [Rhizobium leguminosarum]MBY5485410.1 tyrosine-type recombinase/integrase [Rhizobium leguminosarum]TBZ31053.1 integrase [Rhizobium leguminosarum bv. viciae]TBZ52124.1 integrase [Rhizobium leguminosarum bv. viciae]
MEGGSDRYLSQRNGIYFYKRRVPLRVASLDDREPIIRTSLKTRDLAKARVLRDGYERADEDFWGALLSSDSVDAAKLRYRSAVKRVEALGYTYRTTMEIFQNASWAELVDRLRTLMDVKPNSPASNALLGTVERPGVLLTEAFQVYVNEIAASEIVGHSPDQKRNWLKVKTRAINNFVRLVGDKPIADITRDDALVVFKFWKKKIAPTDEGEEPTHSPSSGNRDLGNLRKLYEEYHKHVGVEVAKNPFAGLRFADDDDYSRPPFPVEWIVEKILAPGALASLNEEARGILLAMIETGARPSEIANLPPHHIHLDDKPPFIAIQNARGKKGRRKTKTKSSVRKIPLVGVALEVFKKHPDGFPRYRDKGSSLSATLMKHFKNNHMLPTEEHVIYSLRHSFEDRMTEGDIDTEVRMVLMGHVSARPKYGMKGTLGWQHAKLLAIALPFDPSIV